MQKQSKAGFDRWAAFNVDPWLMYRSYVSFTLSYWHAALTLMLKSASPVYIYIMSNLQKIFTGTTQNLFFSFTVISDIFRCFIPFKTTFIKYWFNQWNSKLPGSFEIHWIRQYLANFSDLTGIVNATVYKTEPIVAGLRHGKLSQFLALYVQSRNYNHASRW